jgi:hypothetical protein
MPNFIVFIMLNLLCNENLLDIFQNNIKCRENYINIKNI